MKEIRTFLLFFALIPLFFACSPTQHLKDNEYMLTRNVVKVTDQKSDEFDDLYYFVRPLPNKKFIDVFPIKPSLYATFQPKVDPQTDTIIKDTKFRKWLRSLGEAPVLLDTSRIAYSENQLKIQMRNLGFFNAEVSSAIQYKKRKRAVVTYSVTAHEPYFVSDIKYSIEIPEYRRIILQDTVNRLVQVGEQYNAEKLLAEKDRIITTIRDKGYYYVPNNIVYFLIDTMQLADNQTVRKTVGIEIRVTLAQVTDPTILEKYAYKYKFNNTYIYSNYDANLPAETPMDTMQFVRGRLDETRYFFITPKLPPKRGKQRIHHDFRYRTLTDVIYTKRDFLYTKSAVNRSYKRLSDLRNFSYMNIEFQDIEGRRDTVQKIGWLNTIYKLSRQKIHSFAAEIDVRSDKANLSLTYSNKNIFKSAEYFNVNVYGGLDILFKKGVDRLILYSENADAGGEMSLEFPRLFIFRKTQRIESLRYSTSIKLGAHWQRAANLYERLIINTGITYSWAPNYEISHSLTPIDISVVKIDKYSNFDAVISKYSLAFQRKYEQNAVVGLKYTFNYTPILPARNTLSLRLKFESSGLFLTGVNALFRQPKNEHGQWEVFKMDYATFEQAELDLRYKYTINKRNAVAARFNFGIGLPLINSTVLPFEKSFYMGGANSMRAWQFRTLGPGSYYSEERKERSGDLKLEFNIEYRGPIYKFIQFGIFADVGNIWLAKKDPQMPNAEFRFNRFYKELAVAAGAGLRLDFNFFVLRLDVAFPIYDPNELPGNRLINKNSLKKLYIPFAIGYAF